MTIAINLKSIRIDGGTQARVAINEDVVASYAEAMTEGATLPPVVIFRDGTDDWLADGFHRYHAHARIGAVSIDAEILTGTRRDAVLYSVGANGRHGLPPNNADKRKAVTALLSDAEWSTWSDREIAKRCEVGHPFVAKLRKELSLESDSSEESTQRTYTTKHGTQSTMDTAGQKDAAAKKAANGKPAATTAATPRERDDAPSAAMVTTAERAQVAEPDAQAVDDAERMGELACMLETPRPSRRSRPMLFRACRPARPCAQHRRRPGRPARPPGRAQPLSPSLPMAHRRALAGWQ